MANLVYPGGTGITAVSNTELESDDMTFMGTSIAGAAQQTDYTDIRDAITANPGGAIGSGTAATGLNVSGTSDLDGAVTINESGSDVDTRIEGVGEANALVVQGSDGFVGIHTATPGTELEVNGTATVTSLIVGTSTPFSDASGTLTLQNIDALDATTQATILALLRGADQDAPFHDEFWNGQGNEWATRVTTGSVAAQSKDNGWIRLTTGAVNTNEESLDWGDICTFANTKQPTFEVRLQLEQVTNLECYIGLMEASGGSDDDYILFGFDAYTQNTWFCEASSAGSATTDMGAVADTNEVVLKWVFSSDTALEWYIDGVSQGTISSNIPTTQLQPVIMIKTQEAAAHYMDIDYVKIWQDRT